MNEHNKIICGSFIPPTVPNAKYNINRMILTIWGLHKNNAR